MILIERGILHSVVYTFRGWFFSHPF